MLSRLQRAAHREEVNWAPRSDVMTAGTPYLLTVKIEFEVSNAA